MKFTALNYKTLTTLKKRGYNILTSNNNLTDETVYWYPEKIQDLDNYLVGLIPPPFQEPNLLVIDDALNNIDEQDLIGLVLI